MSLYKLFDFYAKFLCALSTVFVPWTANILKNGRWPPVLYNGRWPLYCIMIL